jgi:hypothetical protein
MTKVTILREVDKGNEEPIEFTHFLDEHGLHVSYSNQKVWSNILLLCKNYEDSGFDLMFAYNGDGVNKCLFLGHFNSGKVEE